MTERTEILRLRAEVDQLTAEAERLRRATAAASAYLQALAVAAREGWTERTTIGEVETLTGARATQTAMADLLDALAETGDPFARTVGPIFAGWRSAHQRERDG